jgi:hypothetical protein
MEVTICDLHLFLTQVDGESPGANQAILIFASLLKKIMKL